MSREGALNPVEQNESASESGAHRAPRRVSKQERLATILYIIAQQPIETQEQLAASLREEGIEVTQATVSRDIQELRLVKVPYGESLYRYTQQTDQSIAHEDRAVRTFKDYVISIEGTGNLIVVKTQSGTAPAVAAAIDAWDLEHIIGTVAGDDAILIIVRDVDAKTGQAKPVTGATRSVIEELLTIKTM